jgi:hypothetical protein
VDRAVRRLARAGFGDVVRLSRRVQQRATPRGRPRRHRRVRINDTFGGTTKIATIVDLRVCAAPTSM